MREIILQQKKELRKKMLLLFQEQKKCSVPKKNGELLKLLQDLPLWQQSSSVGLYASLPGEVDLLPLLEEVKKGRRFFFPRIEGEGLQFYEWFPGASWNIGPYGLREPDLKHWKQVSLSEADVILVPGLAFDQSGGRLGRGKGFYDRLLNDPSCKAFKIGIAWSWQIVEHVPKEEHDALMDAVMYPFKRMGKKIEN